MQIVKMQNVQNLNSNGISQGAILDPPLFSIYIKDIFLSASEGLSFYVEDTILNKL